MRINSENLTMQVSYFTDGGFVIHKIPTRSGGSRLSAWFNSEGVLIDAESINILGRSYRPSRADLEQCESLGKAYRK